MPFTHSGFLSTTSFDALNAQKLTTQYLALPTLGTTPCDLYDIYMSQISFLHPPVNKKEEKAMRFMHFENGNNYNLPI